ncbi:hypothetical protein K2Z83_21705 [Oscillochloris sp. ZM17-4]|nr:hypothetical protein [Oscillochloris sp. ZM17-4]MBX0330284.1 hypothetical protein [Oscillochloris sp. ZM17-4]
MRTRCNLQSAICNLQSAICNLQPATCNLQSAIPQGGPASLFDPGGE